MAIEKCVYNKIGFFLRIVGTTQSQQTSVVKTRVTRDSYHYAKKENDFEICFFIRAIGSLSVPNFKTVGQREIGVLTVLMSEL